MIGKTAVNHVFSGELAFDNIITAVDKHLHVPLIASLVQMVHTFFKVSAYAVQTVGMQPPRPFQWLCCLVGRVQGLVADVRHLCCVAYVLSHICVICL